jgi:hypothetical protein
MGTDNLLPSPVKKAPTQHLEVRKKELKMLGPNRSIMNTAEERADRQLEAVRRMGITHGSGTGSNTLSPGGPYEFSHGSSLSPSPPKP